MVACVRVQAAEGARGIKGLGPAGAASCVMTCTDGMDFRLLMLRRNSKELLWRAWAGAVPRVASSRIIYLGTQYVVPPNPVALAGSQAHLLYLKSTCHSTQPRSPQKDHVAAIVTHRIVGWLGLAAPCFTDRVRLFRLSTGPTSAFLPLSTSANYIVITMLVQLGQAAPRAT